jgi:RNA polymerase subunit RPABC4/transcription elongation factor Spt4
MNCPRCSQTQVANAYRGISQQGEPSVLETEEHPFGVAIVRCRSCRGAFVSHDALLTIENGARRMKRKLSASAAARRGFDPPTPTIVCPECSGETTRREWGIGTMVFVDVCIECRGVWLDGGELETLGG